MALGTKISVLEEYNLILSRKVLATNQIIAHDRILASTKAAQKYVIGGSNNSNGKEAKCKINYVLT